MLLDLAKEVVPASDDFGPVLVVDQFQFIVLPAVPNLQPNKIQSSYFNFVLRNRKIKI